MKRLKYLLILAVCLLSPMGLAAQNIKVSGIVTDETGQPLIAAGVVDKTNPRNGVVTNQEGRYTITVSKDAILEFSSLSFASQLINVQGRSTLDVMLQPETTQLESAVAVGYGTSRKGDLTGAVAVVAVEDLQETPATSIAQALQGRIAGAEILSGSGEPGESTSIQIRGSRSISAGNNPLIVVDGVQDAVSSLDELNPSDIVAISVLKDVSSTAIYGSRGANGVILVTTDQKLDKNANYKVTVKSTTGFSHIAGKLDLMNGTEYATWYNMVRLAKSSSVATTPQSTGTAWPYWDPTLAGKGTDWIDVLSQWGIYDNQYASISGGTKNTHITATAGYNYSRGIVIGQDFKRYTARVNLDTRLNKYVTLGLRFNLLYWDANRTSAKVQGTDTSAAIFITPVLDKDAIWNKYAFDDAQGVVFNNPYLLATKVTNRADKWNINLVPWVRINISKRTTLNSSFSFTRQNDLSYYYSPSTMPVATARRQGGTANRSVYDEQKFLSETTVNYKRTFNRNHNLEALGGFTASKTTRDNSYISGSGYLNDKAMYYNMTGIYNTANYYASSYNTIKTSMSVLGRINYNYGRRYYLTLTARADGASNFSESNKWGFFPAAAFRWSIMNEPWMKKSYWLNDLSLRLSAGRSGNDAISSYLSMATLTNNKSSWLFDGKYLLATMPDHLANSKLTWETTDAYNLGINFSGWRSRVNVELDTYWSSTHNLLLSVRNSQVTGYNTYFDNLGETRNIGVELTIDTKNVKTKNFQWNSSFTISHNRQKVVDSGAGDEVVPTYMNPRNSTQYLYGYRTGYPVNALWGYQFAGVWHNREEIERNAVTHTYVSTIADGSNGSNEGRSKYIDVNGDGLLDQNDVVYLGNSDPVLYGGFQNDFKFWGKLNVNIYWAYSIGGHIYNLSELYLGSSASSWNKYRYVLDAWHPVRNPMSNQPEPGWDDTVGSNKQIHDASYLRLKSVTISYNIMLSRWSKFFKTLNIGVTGENLWLLKKYNGFDPDVSTDATVRRLDNGSFPRPRTYTLNLQLNF